MARSQPSSSGARVEWREGDVTALPYNDAAFDVVFCQQGFQFFPDKAHALRDMYRVLIPGGRLALSVWRLIPYNPYLRALSDALERHVSPEVATGMRAVCGLGDADALRALITASGFRNVRIHVVILTMRHPSPAEFIPGQLSALPFADAIQALEPEAQAALVHHIVETLQPYTDDEGLAVPMEAHIAIALK
jgi:SAM-dependent methyltransferase